MFSASLSNNSRYLRTALLSGLTAAIIAVPLVGASSAQAATGETWNRVAACESTGKWDVNTGNGFSGGLQFTPSTWKAFGGAAFASSAHQASKAQQIQVAERVLKAQGPGAWPVCSKKAGLTR